MKGFQQNIGATYQVTHIIEIYVVIQQPMADVGGPGMVVCRSDEWSQHKGTDEHNVRKGILGDNQGLQEGEWVHDSFF